MWSSSLSVLAAFLALSSTAQAFVAPRTGTRGLAIKPLQENFFIELPTLNDPNKVTPKLLNGEENYKNFVAEYNPNALLLGGEPYQLIKRVRELELLSKTVDSGLLEALQEKGVTLTQLERALPIIDNAGLLPLLVKNKGLLLGLLPLLVEPAPALLPVVASVIKTPASSFGLIGVVFLVAGLLEGTVGENGLLGAVAVLLGVPGFVLATVLEKIGEPLPAVSSAPVMTTSSPSSSSSSSRPRVAARRTTSAAPSVPKAPKTRASVRVSAPIQTLAAPAPKMSKSSPVSAGASAGSQNGKRKTVRIN